MQHHIQLQPGRHRIVPDQNSAILNAETLAVGLGINPDANPQLSWGRQLRLITPGNALKSLRTKGNKAPIATAAKLSGTTLPTDQPTQSSELLSA